MLTRPPERLTAANQRRLQRLVALVVADVLRRYRRVPTRPTDDQLEQFIAGTVSIVLAGQTVTVRTVDAYLSAAAGLATGTSTRPLGLDPAQLLGAKARNGTPLETVYRRPFFDAARADLDRTYIAGRLAQTAATDLQLAQRDAAQARMAADPRTPRWRRVLSGAEDCPLCTAAAGRTYRNINKLAIHPRCDCSVEPVIDTDIRAVPTAAEVRYGLPTPVPDRVLVPAAGDRPGVEVLEHGELGPVLWVQGQHFDTAHAV